MSRTAALLADSETEIGPRLRGLRTGRGLSLRALADRSGVTAGALSLIENGRNSPSVSTLKKVLAALDLTLGDFFATERPAGAGPGCVIRSRHLVNLATSPGLRYLALPGPNEGRAIQILHEIYARGADTGPEPYSHAGEEAGFCIAGSIEVTVDGRSEVLQPGDAFYFPSELPHRWRNAGGASARMISACTPPTF
jgi:transcriptional regulator with XRE-family HTH domain